ncbi:MAG: hypothetical protein KGJ49_05785 [Alphaproteobacteria bacterium]|nr:hypothetical protein [Alphaproteobacteria bacterium]
MAATSDSQIRATIPGRLASKPAVTPLRLAALTLSNPVAEVAAVALLCPVFLYAALWNGFPFVFFDTGAYVREGLAHFFVPERSAVYSLFLFYAGARASLWYVAFVQCLVTAFAITEFARAVRPQTSLWKLLAIALTLALFTSIAWCAGQIEPDCTTPMLVLALYPLAFRTRRVGWVRGVLLVCIAAFATGAHPSNLGLSAGLAGGIAAAKLARLVWPGLPRANLLPAVLTFALGLGLVLTANYSLTHKLFVNRSGAVFLTARLMGDGIVKRTLDDICPTRRLKLCTYKDRLPPTADAWLWHAKSPFNALGRFNGTENESNIVAAESLRRYPFASLATGLFQALRQFWMFRTGDGFAPEQYVLDPEFKNFLPRQFEHYLEARQQRGFLRFTDVNVVHYPVALLSLIWLGVVLRRDVKNKRWKRAALPAFVFLALTGNALVCGLFSGPHDRYQSRLIWVPALVLLLTERPRLRHALRRPVESGT